jgi:uncharacterized membrane protein
VQLIAITYPDTLTAPLAMEDLEQLSRDFVLRRDEMAVIVHDEHGSFKTYANAVITGEQPTWALFWGALFAMLFFVPFLGMPVGSELAPIIEQTHRTGLDPLFEERVREGMAPGTSALFVLVEKVTPDEVVAGLDAYGGTVLESEISRDGQKLLQETLHARHQVA